MTDFWKKHEKNIRLKVLCFLNYPEKTNQELAHRMVRALNIECWRDLIDGSDGLDEVLFTIKHL